MKAVLLTLNKELGIWKKEIIHLGKDSDKWVDNIKNVFNPYQNTTEQYMLDNDIMIFNNTNFLDDKGIEGSLTDNTGEKTFLCSPILIARRNGMNVVDFDMTDLDSVVEKLNLRGNLEND